MNLKHLLKFYFAENLAGAFTFMGILAICGMNLGISYLLIAYGFKDSDQLTSIWIPLGVIIAISFFTAMLFLNIFDTAVGSFLMCMAVDLELNGHEMPKFGPPTLHEKLDKIWDKQGGNSAM